MIYKKTRSANCNMVTVRLCHELICAGIQFDTEYNPDWDLPKSQRRRKNGYRGSRFDVIIVLGDQILAIIETKTKSTSQAKEQLERYAKYDVPVYLCGIDNIQETVELCKKLSQSKA